MTTTTERARHFPDLPPRPPGESDDAYTDRLTGADGTGRVPYDHSRNRQCSIGWHSECSDPLGGVCQCPCHTEIGKLERRVYELEEAFVAAYAVASGARTGERAANITASLADDAGEVAKRRPELDEWYLSPAQPAPPETGEAEGHRLADAALAASVARGSARDIAQELDNALTGHGPTEVDRDLGLAGEQLTGLLEQARDTLEKVAAADTAEYALGDLLPDDWGKWSSVPGTALARYLRAALAVAERHLGRLPVPGDEDIPGGRL